MSAIRLIYTTFDDEAAAKRIGKMLIAEKLIACANHLGPIISQYEWDGELQEEQEFPVLLKTDNAHVEAAMARLKELHSYDTPAIICWSAEKADSAYENWLSGQLS